MLVGGEYLRIALDFGQISVLAHTSTQGLIVISSLDIELWKQITAIIRERHYREWETGCLYICASSDFVISNNGKTFNI